MPIYEYRCNACSRRSSIFVRTVSSELPRLSCEHCGSNDLARAISRFGIGRSSQGIIEQYGDPSSDPGSEYRDPRQLGQWAERKFQEYGMEMPEETREMIDAARDGQLPGALDA